MLRLIFITFLLSNLIFLSKLLVHIQRYMNVSFKGSEVATKFFCQITEKSFKFARAKDLRSNYFANNSRSTSAWERRKTSETRRIRKIKSLVFSSIFRVA